MVSTCPMPALVGSPMASADKVSNPATNLRNLAALESVAFSASSIVETDTPKGPELAVETGKRHDFWEAAEPPPGRRSALGHFVEGAFRDKSGDFTPPRRAGFTKCEAPVTRAFAGPPRLLFFSFMMYLPFKLALECVGPSQRQRVGSYLLSI